MDFLSGSSDILWLFFDFTFKLLVSRGEIGEMGWHDMSTFEVDHALPCDMCLIATRSRI